MVCRSFLFMICLAICNCVFFAMWVLGTVYMLGKGSSFKKLAKKDFIDDEAEAVSDVPEPMNDFDDDQVGGRCGDCGRCLFLTFVARCAMDGLSGLVLVGVVALCGVTLSGSV